MTIACLRPPAAIWRGPRPRSGRQVAEAGHLVAMSLDHTVDLRPAERRAPLAGLAGAEEAVGDVGLLPEAAPLLLLLKNLERRAADRPLEAVARRAQLQEAIDRGEGLVGRAQHVLV